MPAAGGLFRRLSREPTLHFAALAGALFIVSVLFKWVARPEIVIDSTAVRLRIAEIERGRGTRLSADERRQAENAYVDEQALAREARLRGFDDDDRIRSILYQKMLHVLSGEVAPPSNAELAAYYLENRERYAAPEAASLDDVLVSAKRTISVDIRDPGRLEELARTGQLTRTTISHATLAELTWTIGEQRAEAVFRARPGDWLGPEPTEQGERWLHIIGRFDAAPPPPLESIRDQLRFDWISKREAELLKERIATLRGRYTIKFVDQGPVE